LEEPAEELRQREDRRKNTNTHCQKKLPGNAIKQRPEFQGHEELKTLKVKRFYSINQFFVNTKDKGHGSAGNTRDHIRCAHAKALNTQNNIVGKGSVFTIHFHFLH